MKWIQKLQRYRAALLWAALFIPIFGLAVLAAQCAQDSADLLEWVNKFTKAINRPTSLQWTSQTPRFLLGAMIFYGMTISAYYAGKGNKRPREEYGSAKWGNAGQVNKKYRARKTPFDNLILTQTVWMGLDGRKHQRNVNVLVIGGSGAGKTRAYAKPNLMQCNCSYIVADPKGELLRAVGGLLIQENYEVKVLNLVEMVQSDGYNPFSYLKTDTDALKLITNLIRNTTPKNASQNDPFWEKAEIALLTAFVVYLMHEAREQDQNFSTVMYLIENAAVKEEDENYQSPVDILFQELELHDPNHIAVRYYKVFKQSAGKTAKSILVSAAVRLAAFNLPDLAYITDQDDLDFASLGERKRAIFAVIPDNDASFNFLVGMLYMQAFQALYYHADHAYQGRLPIHVHVIMDEFANVALPDDFERILATMRSREISVSIIIQNMAQLKAMFKDSWENITGNCDTLLYLGGNEQSTHKYISELLGKSTIDTRTHGQSKGRNGSWSTNFQQTGRELMTPDEVRLLDNKQALLFIRGERPIQDRKFNLLQHKRIDATEDGGATSYRREEPMMQFSKQDLDHIPNTKTSWDMMNE